MMFCWLSASVEKDEIWSYSFVPLSVATNTEVTAFASGWTDFSENYGSIGLNWEPTSNLKLEAALFPYKKSEILSHYQMINAEYKPSSSEYKALPVRIHLGMHRLVNRTKAISRWFHLGLNYIFSYKDFQFSAMGFNVAPFDESIRLYGISVMKMVNPNFNPSIGLIFNPNENQFRIQLLMYIHP